MPFNTLIIDDDRFSQKVIRKALQGQFITDVADTGAEGIEKAKQTIPDIIILDVEMPGMNGYEVCDQLKQDGKTKNIPIVFLSSHSSLRERMQGYEAGADDYVVKPFEKETLAAKLSVLVKYRDQQRELKAQYQEAQKTAHIAMSGSSELGLAFQFVENSYTKDNYEELAESFFEMVDRFGLSCSLMFQGIGEPHWFSSSGTISPLEIELMSMMREDKRMYDFGCRTIINYPNVSLLVKNMPIDDMERFGRIKDLLPVVLSTVDAKIMAMKTEEGLQKQTNKLALTLENIRRSSKEINNSMQINQQRGVEILRGMLHELGDKLPHMGLEEDQENFILDSIEAAIDESVNVIDNASDISTTFNLVLSELNIVAKQQQQMIKTSQKLRGDAAKSATPDSGDSYSMDVELF